ncbi:MAG: hypothetical protein V2I50_07320 [Desulfuromusa sp.]|jgi:FtsH-binding integral membrane protein|nr:hypothetical protein [Desulfuromusa sp.]
MLEICINGAQEAMEKLKKFMASPIGLFLSAFVTGLVGIVLLLAFLSMVLSPSVLLLILPGIIAFNGAAGGYSLIEKTEGTYPHRKMALTSLAALLTITGCSIITLFCPWEPLVDGSRYLVSGLSTLIFTFLGSWIAYKSKRLKR